MLVIQFASIVIPVLVSAHISLTVLPEMRTLVNTVKQERDEEEKHFERVKACRTKITTDQALLLIDLEESIKMAKAVNSLLKGD
jgi:hypothetical protein